jgi:hypothetical protein
MRANPAKNDRKNPTIAVPLFIGSPSNNQYSSKGERDIHGVTQYQVTCAQRIVIALNRPNSEKRHRVGVVVSLKANGAVPLTVEGTPQIK